MNHGSSWWTYEKLRISFWRPLTELTLWDLPTFCWISWQTLSATYLPPCPCGDCLSY